MQIFIPLLLSANAEQNAQLVDYCPSLDHLLRYAKAKPLPQMQGDFYGPTARFLQACNIAQPVDDQDWPLAHCAAAAAGLPKAVAWAYLDPVQLTADQNGLYCQGQAELELSTQEAQDFIVEINALIAEDGLTLYLSDRPERWLLASQQPIQVQTIPLYAMQDQTVALDHIKGPNSRRWQALLAEIGMLLNQSAINQKRLQQGKKAINALWLWGAGQIESQASQTNGLKFFVQQSKRGQGIARLLNLGQVTDINQADVVYSELCEQAVLQGNLPAWQHALAELETTVFAPILKALKSGAVTEVSLDLGGQQCFYLKSWYLKKFWRRFKALF